MNKVVRKIAELTIILTFLQLATTSANAIETISPGAVDAYVKGHRGTLDLLVSSSSAGCKPCAAANKRFELLAKNANTSETYASVSWSPWNRFPPEMQSFFKRYGIKAIPVRLQFRDGQLIDILNGEPPKGSGPSPVNVYGTVEQIKPEDAMEVTKNSKGTLVVMLSSFETRCDFCMRGNMLFEELAKTPGASHVKFARVMYSPWHSFKNERLAKEIHIQGLPIYLTFQNGKGIHGYPGVADINTLRKRLLDRVSD